MGGIAPGTTVLERYVVVKHLLGTRITDLYRARNTSTDEEVVIKALRRGVGDVVAQRFEREARMMSVIMHPNVVRLQTYGTVDSRPCLVMESVDGERLDRMIAREGAIAWPEAVKWMLGLLSGLEAVHAARVVHRDVAPNNIVITRDGKTKLTNLDLATMSGGASSVTTGGEVLGIPHYIAPERALQAKTATALSDVYSAGATLYHMLSGRVPFPAANFRELTQAFSTLPRPPQAPPGLPSIPPSIQEAIAAAIEADPSKRTRSARQFATMLRAGLREAGVAARASGRRSAAPGASSQRGGRPEEARRRRTSTRMRVAPRGPGPSASGVRPPASRQPSKPRPTQGSPPDRHISGIRGATASRSQDFAVQSRSDTVRDPTANPSIDMGFSSVSPPEPERGLELAIEPAGTPEIVQETGYAVDPLMGYGAFGEGPPADATDIPGASPVLAPNVPGGPPRMGDVSLELELGGLDLPAPAMDAWGSESLELDVDDEELREAGITQDGAAPETSSTGLDGTSSVGYQRATASESIPSSYAFTQAATELEDSARVSDPGHGPRPVSDPGLGAPPFGIRQHSARTHGSSAPVLGLRSSRATGPQRTMDSKPLTLPPGVHEAGQRAQATATGSSPYAMPRRETPSSMFAARRVDGTTQPHLATAQAGLDRGPLHTPSNPPSSSPPVDDDLPIDYSGPDPLATPDPRRNQRFSTGSSTLRQAAVVRAEMDMPEDVDLPPLRKLYAVLACRAVDPAPPATKVGVWLESQLRGRGGVRILSSEVFFIVLNADNPEHGQRLASVILGALSKAFGKDIQVRWELAEGTDLDDALRPSAPVPPVVEDLLASLH